MRRISPLALLVIPFAALIVVMPLILHGCSCGHDFDFHLISWMEAAAQFKAGTLHPAWAFSPAWNAGEPRFVFYPPMSWTLGAVLGMVLPWAAVPIVYTWLALVAAGFAMWWLARELVGDDAAMAGPLLAAVVYVANPYMIFTAYERTAYAELLAAAWIPLLLAAILSRRVTVLRVAIPVALLWLTNAPAAVMGSYSLGVLAVVRLAGLSVEARRERANAIEACLDLAWRVIAGVALGLGVAAFYIVPAAYERRWVQIAMAMVSGMRIGDNFLFHQTGDGPHDEVLHTASMIAVGMLGAAAIVFVGIFVRSRYELSKTKQQVISLGLLAAMIGLLMTPLSAVIWRVAPEMSFLQFPWRLVAVLAAVLCAGIGIVAERIRLQPLLIAACALMVVSAMSWPSVTTFRQECDEEDTVAARLAVFNAHTGTDPTDEYTPVQADNDSLAHGDPQFWLGVDGDAKAEQDTIQRGPVPSQFTIDADKPEVLILNLRDYPAWQVRLNGSVVTERLERADGLIAFQVPAGESHVGLTYRTTRDREIGDGISMLRFVGRLRWERGEGDEVRPRVSSEIDEFDGKNTSTDGRGTHRCCPGTASARYRCTSSLHTPCDAAQRLCGWKAAATDTLYRGCSHDCGASLPCGGHLGRGCRAWRGS